MKKVLKTPCKLTLEEEYAFEHQQRIKAEAYIAEVWEMNQELTEEVLRLQKVLNDKKYPETTLAPSSAKIRLKTRLDNIYKDREKALKKLEARWEKKKN